MSNLLQQMAVGALTSGTLLAQLVAPTTISITEKSDGPQTDAVATSLSFAHKAPDELEIWINGLIQLESRGKHDALVLDVNGRYSYGCLQFQKHTFVGFGKGYGLLSQEDLANLDKVIYNCDLQKRIARRMLQKDPGAWKHWYTSVAKRGLGLPPGAKSHENDIARQ